MRSWMGITPGTFVRLAALVLLTCAGSLAALPSQLRAGPEPEKKPAAKAALPVWQPSLAKALAAAEEKGIAVMIALNLDGERGNQGMVDGVYRSADVRKAAENCVVAIASLGKHTEIKDDVTGRTVCSRFGSVTCAEHQELERIIREDWLKRGPKDDVESPRHFFLAPDGRILFQRTWTVGSEELAAMMTRASELCSPLTLQLWDTPDGRLARALDPLPFLRQTALTDLLSKNDDALDSQLAAAAAKAKDPVVRADVAGALIRAEGGKRLAHAAMFLTDKDVTVRVKTATALEYKPRADAVNTLLARAAKEREARVRSALYRALGACGAGEERVRDLLLKACKKKKDVASGHAIVALAPWAADAAVIKTLVKMPWGKYSLPQRKAATWVLGLCGDKDLIPRLEELAKENKALEYLAPMAAKRLAGTCDEKAYMGASRWAIRHPIYEQD